MFNLSSEFKKFYDEEVVLPSTETQKLRNKKKINIDRLKAGLEEYNEENNTTYKIAETREQGSVAMATVTQNDSNDYDIDVAIIFDKGNIDGIGHIKIKNIIVDALKRKCTNFKTEPEALKNCVRIVYNDGYHIDFAIYRKSIDDDGNEIYEHAGSTQWQERNPAAINNWFNEEIKEKGDGLRKTIRLSKMFCKSRDSWNMPGGLIQTVICDEVFEESDRLDEMFYNNMCAVRDRLNESIEVNNPTDTEKSLLLKEKDKDEMNNWKKRISDKIDKLDILFDDDCTENDAKNAWYDFFKHDYWSVSSEEFSIDYTDTEQNIADMFDLNVCYPLELECIIEADGFRPKRLTDFLKSYKWIPHRKTLRFSVSYTTAPYGCDIYWKVRNVGEEAIKRNCIRGQIIKTNKTTQIEHSSFRGEHYVECYYVKNDQVVAMSRIDVPIE